MKFFMSKQTDEIAIPADAIQETSWSKVPPGALIKCEYVKSRVYGNLQRIHVMFNLLWQHADESTVARFGTVDNFRYAVEYAAGIIDVVPNVGGTGYITRVKSLSYDSIEDENEFKEIFSRITDYCLREFPTWTKDELHEIVENIILGF